MSLPERLVLVCGSRMWPYDDLIEDRIAALDRDVTIIHGGAMGADSMAGKAAHALGFKTRVFYPDYPTHGRRAPLERNLEMLDQGPELVIAFDAGTSGTGHTITHAKERGIPVEVHTP